MDKHLIEVKINEAKKRINYNTIDLPLEYYINRARSKDINVKDTCMVRSHRTRLIESVLLGLPVLNIVLISEDTNIESRDQIEQQFVTGKNKLLSAIDFTNNGFELTTGDVKVTALTGVKFEDLSQTIQRKFIRATVKAIVIRPGSDLNLWQST